MQKYKVENCRINTIYGPFEFFCFNWGDHEDENILCLHVKSENTPIVRLQSACFTAEIFRSTDCDCHEQLEYSLRLIQKEGGYFLYLLQDGRGAGIFNKTRGLKLGDTLGLDTADAYDYLGINRDPRNYERANQVLHYFQLTNIRLLTNNPRKIQAIEESGIKVERLAIEIPTTSDSLSYLITKRDKMGHLLKLTT